MHTPLVFTFAGQGTQQFGMARKLLSMNPNFRSHVLAFEENVKAEVGVSLIADVFESGRPLAEPMVDLRLSHPALFVVQYALAQSLVDDGVDPDYVLGASLGEIVAMVVAGVLDPQEGLRVVLEQVQSLEAAGCAGGMLAILGDFRELGDDFFAVTGAELAAMNSTQHFVVSGTSSAMRAAAAWATRRRLPFQELPVPCGFHSSAMDSAQTDFAHSAGSDRYRLPLLPIASCLQGGFKSRYEPGDLYRIVREPMLIQPAIAAIEAAAPNARYFDLSPAGTMGNTLRRTASVRATRVRSLLQPPDGMLRGSWQAELAQMRTP